MSLNELNPYFEENIKQVYPENFPVQIEKIGTNYLPLVINSLKILCHPFVDWVENYIYFLIFIPFIFFATQYRNGFVGILIILTGFNGFYQSLRSGNFSIIAQIILVLFFITLFKRKLIISSLLFSILAYIKITILPIYLILLFAIKNKLVKKFINLSFIFFTGLILITYVIEEELLRTWLEYYTFFSNSENINSFNVLNDTFGNYYDTPSIPNLLFYLFNFNLILFFVTFLIIVFTLISIFKSLRSNNLQIEEILMNSFIIYFLFNPYIRTYHLIEFAIFLSFYLIYKNQTPGMSIIFYCLIPQLTILEIGPEILSNAYILLVSLYPPIVFLIFTAKEKLEIKKYNFSIRK